MSEINLQTCTANIDLTQAPSGTTHYCEQTQNPRWWNEGDDWSFWNSISKKWENAHDYKLSLSKLILKPIKKSWSGEGLPPVGAVCEYQVGDGTWFPCTVQYITHPIAGDDKCAVITCPHLNGDQVSRIGDGEGDVKFRPIRTPEQIAEEQRQKAEIASVVYALDLMHMTESHAKHIADAIHLAGYRKQEPKP